MLVDDFKSYKEKVITIATYYVYNDSTIRKTADYFNLSKSTVCRIINSPKLRLYNRKLNRQVFWQKRKNIRKGLKALRDHNKALKLSKKKK